MLFGVSNISYPLDFFISLMYNVSREKRKGHIMYYALIFISVAMFGGCFALNDVYRIRRGSSLKISMEASFLGAVAAVLILFVINRFKLEFTLFTLIMGAISAINAIGFTVFSFNALNSINLSLYSLFSMLGGMALPFAQGIIFYEEKITLAKILCVIFICAALACTVTKGESRGGFIYYAGIFILNGMSGVLSKLFNELPYEKTSAAGYTFWIAVCTLILSGALWLALSKNKSEEEKRMTLFDCAVGATNGGMNRIANFLLVIALAHVDASVQYPAVTGGVMIVSTLICFFGQRKPQKKELFAVALAFIGTLALFVIPV